MSSFRHTHPGMNKPCHLNTPRKSTPRCYILTLNKLAIDKDKNIIKAALFSQITLVS